MARRGDGELPEIEVDGAVVPARSSTTVRRDGASGHGRDASATPASLPTAPARRGRRRIVGIVAAAAAVVAFIAIGAVAGGGDAERATAPTPSPEATGGVVARPSPTVAPLAAPALGADIDPLVRSASAPVTPLPGADGLDAAVVLAPFPHPGSGTRSAIHVLGPKGMLSRDDAPLFPADFPYPIITVAGDGRVRTTAVFSDRTTVWAMTVERRRGLALGDIEAIASGSSVIPHARPDRVWVVGPDRATVTEVDPSGAVAPREYRAGGWPVAGIADGILVALADGYGSWTPDAGTRRLDQVPEGGVFVASSPTRFAVVYRVDGSGRIAVIDPGGSVLVSSFVVPGLDVERGSVAASFSPDGARLAVVAGRGDGDLTLVDVSTGDVLASVADVGALQAPTWTSDRQLVYLTEAPLTDRLELWRLDLDDESLRPVADLGAPTGWWLGRAR